MEIRSAFQGDSDFTGITVRWRRQRDDCGVITQDRESISLNKTRDRRAVRRLAAVVETKLMLGWGHGPGNHEFRGFGTQNLKRERIYPLRLIIEIM